MADQVKNLIATSNANAGGSGFDITQHVPPRVNTFGFNKEATLKERVKQSDHAAQAAKTKIPNWWGGSANPIKRTDKTELMAQRKSEKAPHISFDLDGDGYVGNRDFVIAKHFDKDGDGILNTNERAATTILVATIITATTTSTTTKQRLICDIEGTSIRGVCTSPPRGQICSQRET